MCQGGPLMKQELNSGRITLIGIISFGSYKSQECGSKTIESFTEVFSYLPWTAKRMHLFNK